LNMQARINSTSVELMELMFWVAQLPFSFQFVILNEIIIRYFHP